MPRRGGLSRKALSYFETRLLCKTAANSVSLNEPVVTGRPRSSPRRATAVASSPRRLHDEHGSYIFLVPPWKCWGILQATGVLGHTTLGGSRSYQGISGIIRQRLVRSRSLLPPFDDHTAAQKAGTGARAWNSRDPARVALAYTPDRRWRNEIGRSSSTAAMRLRHFLNANGQENSITA
jgi:Protein of unknown function (DUF1348)